MKTSFGLIFPCPIWLYRLGAVNFLCHLIVVDEYFPCYWLNYLFSKKSNRSAGIMCQSLCRCSTEQKFFAKNLFHLMVQPHKDRNSSHSPIHISSKLKYSKSNICWLIIFQFSYFPTCHWWHATVPPPLNFAGKDKSMCVRVHKQPNLWYFYYTFANMRHGVVATPKAFT